MQKKRKEVEEEPNSHHKTRACENAHMNVTQKEKEYRLQPI